MELNNIQKLAVKFAVESDFIFCISGSAGTGKSTVISAIYDKFNGNADILAPTGRAAKLLRDKIGTGQTIHKYLEFYTDDFGCTYKPKYDDRCMLGTRNVIIDEASMVSKELFSQLLKALKTGSRVILVGDENQLPPIEDNVPISIFNNCINKYPSIRLEIKYRFGNQINISNLADAVLDRSFKGFVQSGLTYQLDGVTDDMVISKLCSKDKYIDFDSQIICPTYKGRTGCDWINKLFQQRRFGSQNRLVDNMYRRDKVICTMNTDYFLNGDIYYLSNVDESTIELDDGQKTFMVPRFFNINRKLTIDLITKIRPAYAITTHKSQGGQYSNVTYIAGKSAMPVLGNSNIYTGVTRSSENLVVLYDKYTLQRGLQNV